MRGHKTSGRLLACSVASLALSGACSRDPRPLPAATSARAATAPSGAAAPRAAGSVVERDEQPAPVAASASASASGRMRQAAASVRGMYDLDEPTDVGPAGPTTASATGVVFTLRDRRVSVAKLSSPLAAPGPGSKPMPTPVKPIDVPATELVARGRGPAVLGAHAYFVSKGQLVRRGLEAGDVEVLDAHALDGTRVSVSDALGPAVAAFIAPGPSGDPIARLWVEKQGVLELTPEAASASAVSLARAEGALIALSFEARTGMTQFHARRVTRPDSSAKLGEDVVTWVAGPSQPTTEVTAVSGKLGEVWGLVAIERDGTRFGLARIDVGASPRLEAPVVWRAFENGLDPAPVATAAVCGAPVALYVRPVDASAHAAQVIELAPIEATQLGRGIQLGRASAVNDLSIAAVDGGALAVWCADGRTWAITLHCPR